VSGNNSKESGQKSAQKSALHAKLRRLRRESPKASDGDQEDGSSTGQNRRSKSAGMPPWLTARLGRRDRLRKGEGPHASRAPAHARATVGTPLNLVQERNAKGVFSLREVRYALDHRHGSWALGEAAPVDCAELATLAKDSDLASLELMRGVYLDIETTGLSGGAGTTPFMVALGWFEARADTDEGVAESQGAVSQGAVEFVLWQGFLCGPEEEAALLQAVADRVSTSAGVVSFFGKSFDRHRLEDKMRVHGVAPPFADRPHLDLYHPLRRLYREALENGKLQTMERYLCDVVREDDLPGSFAPAAWFDFLAGRAHRLEDVFRHNADDVLSLVVLAAHLGCTLQEQRAEGGELSGCPVSRAKGVTKVMDDLRRRPEALPWLERYEERGGSPGSPAFQRIAARVRRMSR
jgi:uncharacterized protein YprB with RNaseH-like and TPR domain